MRLTWTPANREPSGGIKVTASVDNPQPLYPRDGYVAWLPGAGHSECLIPRHKAVSAKPRHYRVCSVARNDHGHLLAISNVVTVPPIPGEMVKPDWKPPPLNIDKQPGGNTPRQIKPVADQPVVDSAWSVAPVEPTAALPAVRRPGGPLIVGHGDTNVGRIPPPVIEKAKRELRVWYGHTSHGSQITSGMAAMRNGLFHFNWSGADGALKYVETGGDLGHRGADAWERRTREYLERGGDANVIVWSWCGGCSDNTPDGVDRYLNLMNGLERDYPNRVFVYMTGHLDGTGENGNLHRVNERIRAYCRRNDKVLFDFADIESYDPDGRYFLPLGARDSCDYRRPDGSRGNWAVEWIQRNPNHGIALPERAAHTHPLNGALKGRAFWSLLARIVGWEGHGDTERSAVKAPLALMEAK